jgi:hypothetical protein
LVIADNAAGSPHAVALSGNGVQGGPAAIAVSPASITFPDQTVGVGSSPLNVTVSNTGGASAQITGLTFTGANSGDFTTTSVAPITVAAGGTATLPVKFTPGAAGSRSATLTVFDNTGGSAHTVALSGKGVQVLGIIVNPTSIDFQNQTVNTASAPVTVTIQNTSANPINATSFVLAGLNASDFTVAAVKTPWPIAANGTFTFNVLFTPKDLGTRTGTIIINDDSGGPAHTISLTGVGATGVPTIGLNPNSLAFANQGVGTASAPSTITITNTGTTALLIKGIAFGGSNPGDFVFPANFTPPTPANPITVAVNGSTTISVIFQPTASGTRTATLALTDNTNNSPHSVGLTGNGSAPAIALAPSPLSFADQNVGSASAPSTIAVTNTGNGVLMITGLAFAGTNPGDFAFPASFTVPTPAAPISVAANGGTTNIPVIFGPLAASQRSASLIVVDNAAGSPHSVALSGKGLPSTITLSPSSLDFGTQLKGVASTPLAATVTNTGTADIQITGLSLTGANASDFAAQESGTINVAANGGTVTLYLVFTPSATGTRSATLVITDTAAGSPHSLQLTGAGIAPQFTISPTSVAFADQTVPSTSSPVTLLVRNIGSAPLHITSVTFAGTNPGDFQTSTPGPFTVDSNNGTATLSVTFKPTAIGNRSATLVINDDASGSLHTIPLTGKGVGLPIFSITPTSLNFGSVPANKTSTPQTLRITNTGSADLTIDFVSRSGANPSEFQYTVLGTLGSSDFPETLGPGASVDVNVFFTPTDGGGTRSALFIFHDNAADSPQTVAVTGTSIPSPPSLSISPAGLTFGTQQLNTTSGPLALMLQNTGGATLNITNIAFTGPNGSEFAAAPLAPISIAGGGTASISVTFTPGGTGTRSATLNLSDNSGGGPHTDTVAVSGTGANSVGTISLPALSLGGNLETLATASLDQAPGSDLQVTITSSDPSKFLLSPVSSDPNGTQTGSGSITGTVKKGQGKFGFGFPGFWVQALVSTGAAQITVSAPGYNSGVATVTFTRSGIVLNSPTGVGANFATTKDALLTVGSVQLDSNGNQIGTQALRGGLVANVTVSSGTPATGTIVGNPAVLQPGHSTSSQVTFHPLAIGTTVLSIAQPNGFFSPAIGTQLTATVTMPSIQLTRQSIGYNLLAQGDGQLDTSAPNGGLQVTLTSSDTSKILLSTSPTGAGAASINLLVQAGSTSLQPYFLQALSNTGSATITGTATGYTSGTANVALFPTAFVINSPNGGGNFTTTTISPVTPLTLTVWQLGTDSRPLVPGQLRPGVSESVTVNSGNPGAGGITGNPAAFQSGNVSNSTLAFLPSQSCSAPCTSVLSVSQPSGYTQPATGGQITATVNQPSVTIRMVQSTIGKDLQVVASGALDAPAPSDVQVTISSNNPNVLLSTSPTVVGSSSITGTVFAGAGVNSIGFPTYYVQALANSGTATLTASAPGFASTTFVVTLAPSGFVITGPNGIGANFGVLMMNGNVTLSVFANVLDPNTLAPTLLSESIRAGVIVAVTSNSSGVAVIQNSPVTFNAGDTSATVTLTPTGPGQAVISVLAPSGFTAPSNGAQLTVTVN